MKNIKKTYEEENFRNFFKNNNDFLFILDMEGNIIEINDAVTNILGYSKKDLFGKSVLLVHPAEFRAEAQETVLKMLDGSRESCPIPLVAKSNIYIPVETRVSIGYWNGEKALIGISRNLSEIALSESKFREVFNNSQVLMAISEIDTARFVDVNERFLATFGLDKSQVIGKTAEEIDLFFEKGQQEDIIDKVTRNIRTEDEIVIATNKEGDKIYFLFSAAKIKIQTYEYILTSATVISHIINVENKLKHNLKQQTLLSDISQNLNSIQNIEQKLDETLRVLGEHTNVSRVYIFEDDNTGSVTNNTFEWCNTNILPQKDELQGIPYEVIPSWKKIFTEKGKIFSTNIKELPEDLLVILEPQGIKSILVFPIIIQEKFSGFIGFDECVENRNWQHDEIELLRTITNIIANSLERQRFQKQLSESEARLKMAIENTETGLWDWDIKTGQVYYNEVWCNMLGYTLDEISTDYSTWERLAHPDDLQDINVALDAHLSGETEMYSSIHRLLTKSGDWKWVLDKGKVIERDEKGTPIRAIGTHTDIDNQKRTESELKKINATKDKLFSIIGHDLRGPIGGLMQMLDFINDKDTNTSEVFFAFLKNMKVLAHDSYQLLENLLYWSLESRKELCAKPEKINLNQIIQNSININTYSSKNKNITIINSVKEICYAYADENMINLVMRNLISNSLKYTPDNGTVKINMTISGNLIKVVVSDNGVGISPENIEAILSEETYLSTRGTKNEKGSGLGIKLCKDFIRINHGEFYVQSKVGKGSKFSFTLPNAKFI